jgi:hypothetical protein
MGVRLFVPGRLCLLGEHSDWAGAYRTRAAEVAPGRCLVTATDQGLHAEAEADEDVVELASVLPGGGRVGPERFAADAAALAAAATGGGFFSYAAGVAAEMVARHRVRGLRLTIVASDLPPERGLSSSAAACVLVARAYDRLYGLGLSVEDEMDLAYRGERRTGSACGRMDQVCALGRRTVLLTFDGDDFALETVTPAAAVPLLVVDLRRTKDTRRILADLNACFPATPGALAAGVREALGRRNAILVGAARAALEQATRRGWAKSCARPRPCSIGWSRPPVPSWRRRGCTPSSPIPRCASWPGAARASARRATAAPSWSRAARTSAARSRAGSRATSVSPACR